MKVLLSWLREFAPFEGDPVALGDDMSDLGMAVESIERLGEGLDGIIVAEVLDLRPHPDADKIQLVDVDTGDGDPLQICCGAFNMTVGDRVPLATLGTTMPDGLEIARRKLRGQWSNGMLCSGRELGLGDDHEGILVLPRDSVVGGPVTTALGVDADVLYDLEINPNRPDAMSVAGVARDLAARRRLPFSIPEPPVVEAGADAMGRCAIELVDPDLCGRFYARILDGVRVGGSPAWLARRLTLLGMRPINSVVDVSNYVMLELGQPNHTYDLAKIRAGALRVRWARDGERITTLDGVERILCGGDGVIADGDDAPVGIAGVMGGASTEITDQTTTVLLEMAWWDPMTVARSSRRLGLRSEASMRFERGADPEAVELAARRFATLLESSGATLAPGAHDARGVLPDRSPVRVRTSRVNRLLGTQLTATEIAAAVAPIGFECVEGADGVDVVVPSWRYDTATETDVIEEVARHVGYSRLARRRPMLPLTGSLSPRQADRRLVRSVLAGIGLAEAMPTPLLSPDDLRAAELDPTAVAITNPLAAEESVLRTSLRPGLLKAVAHNAAHRNTGVALFEVGTVFLPPAADSGPLPDEREHLAVVAAGCDATEAVRVLDVLVERLHVDALDLIPERHRGLHPARAATVLVRGVAIGRVGELDPAVGDRFAIAERVAVLEVDLGALLDAPRSSRGYRPVSRYPSSDVDLAFVTPDAQSARALASTLYAASPLVVHVGLFDVYRGDGVEAGHRSLAYRLRLQAPDRTLTDAEVATARRSAIAAVTDAHGATLRGG